MRKKIDKKDFGKIATATIRDIQERLKKGEKDALYLLLPLLPFALNNGVCTDLRATFNLFYSFLKDQKTTAEIMLNSIEVFDVRILLLEGVVDEYTLDLDTLMFIKKYLIEQKKNLHYNSGYCFEGEELTKITEADLQNIIDKIQLLIKQNIGEIPSLFNDIKISNILSKAIEREYLDCKYKPTEKLLKPKRKVAYFLDELHKKIEFTEREILDFWGLKDIAQARYRYINTKNYIDEEIRLLFK